MEETNLEDVLNEEDAGLDGNGEDTGGVDVEPKEPIDESDKGSDEEGLPVEGPKEDESGQEEGSEDDSPEEVAMMNAYESRNRAKSIQVDRDTDEIVEHMEQIRGAIERAVEEGMLSAKVDFLAHRVALDELKRLGYIAGHVSGEEKTHIRWD